MSILQRAAQILAEAETALKRLIGEAAEAGDYTAVEMLVRCASSLSAMHVDGPNAVTQAESAVSPDFKIQPSYVAGSKRNRRPTRSIQYKRRSYPVFAKATDALVKIAWSKSSKSEYQHKSPQFVIKKLAEALARHAKNGAVASMDKILPIKAEDGSDIPDYQVYVSLAWFRKIGVVKQNGRQGYTIKNATDYIKTIDAAWDALPEVKAG